MATQKTTIAKALNAGLRKAMENDPKVPRAKCTREQAARVAWRIAEDWLKAQAALIDASLASLDEVMLPYMVTRYDGDRALTVYGAFREQQLALTDHNEQEPGRG